MEVKQSNFLRLLSTYSIPIAIVVLIIVFSIMLPGTFLTGFTFRSILSTNSIIAILALAVTVPLACNSFDLSVGYFAGLAHIASFALQVKLGVPWPIAALCVIALGFIVGLTNGMLITRVGIHPFIATLGSGTIIYGLSEWITGGNQIVGPATSSYYSIVGTIFGIPMQAIYLLIIAIIMWIVFEYTPTGRFFYVVGENSKAAELNGISPKRYTLWAFVVSGVLVAIAGVLLASELRNAQATVGPDYLLPAFAAAFLGATSIRPGRVNICGTVLAVFLLAILEAGIQQLGAQFYMNEIFNGFVLVVAVALSVTSTKRRQKKAAQQLIERTDNREKSVVNVG